MDHEVQKMHELDNQYESELKDWKQNLRYRKQVQLSLATLLLLSLSLSQHSLRYFDTVCSVTGRPSGVWTHISIPGRSVLY